MSQWPREYRASLVIIWSVMLILALVQAIPYWAGGHTWLIHSGRVYPIATFSLLGARLLYYWRYGSMADIERRYGPLSRRQTALGALLLVAGLAPSIVLIVIVTAQAGVTEP